MAENRYLNFFTAALAQFSGTSEEARQEYVQTLLNRIRTKLIEGGHPPEAVASEMDRAIAAAEQAWLAQPPVSASVEEPLPAEVRQEEVKPEAAESALEQAIEISRKPWVRWLFLTFVLASYALSIFFFLAERADLHERTDTAVHDALLSLDIAVAEVGKDNIVFHVTPAGGRLVDKAGHLTQEIVMVADAGSSPVEHSFKAHVPITPWQVNVSIDGGDILDYPFDRHWASFSLLARSEGKPLNISTELNHVPHGFKAHHEEEAGEDGAIEVKIEIKRSGVILFVIALSVFSLLLVTLSASAVAWHVALNSRKIEFGMMVWTAALLFVIPSVRGALPGAAPVGAMIDFLFFFWIQAVVAIAMASLVVTWVRRAQA